VTVTPRFQEGMQPLIAAAMQLQRTAHLMCLHRRLAVPGTSSSTTTSTAPLLSLRSPSTRPKGLRSVRETVSGAPKLHGNWHKSS
jgi:hypothetical protein